MKLDSQGNSPLCMSERIKVGGTKHASMSVCRPCWKSGWGGGVGGLLVTSMHYKKHPNQLPSLRFPSSFTLFLSYPTMHSSLLLTFLIHLMAPTDGQVSGVKHDIFAQITQLPLLINITVQMTKLWPKITNSFQKRPPLVTWKS